MTPYLAIARTTARQVIGGRRFVGFLLLALAPAIILFLSTPNQTSRASVDSVIEFTLAPFFVVVVPVIAILLATTSLGADRRDATISFIALRPLSRPLIALAKILGSFTTAYALTGAGALGLGIVSTIRLNDAGYVIPLLVGTLIATLAYGAVLVPLGYATERASVIGLAYAFVWESAIAGTIPGLAWSSLWRIGFIGFADLAPDDIQEVTDRFAFGDLAPSLGSSLTRVVILTAIATAVTGWMLRTRDLV